MRKVVTGSKWRMVGEARANVISDMRSACASRVRRGLVQRAPSGALAIIIMQLAIASCGFQPLHSEAYRAQHAVDLSSIRVLAVGSATENIYSVANNMDRRYSELLTAEIQDQANPTSLSAEKLFTLAITFNETDAASFVKPDGTASRGDLNYVSSYTITRLRDESVVANGTISRVSTYNTSPSADYASYVSIEDARKRGILELAQDYKLRLAALLPKLNDPNTKAIKAPEFKPESIPALQPIRSHETLRSGY